MSTITSPAAYNYPVGIPVAWIDPDSVRPARPDPWQSETPGYYYINNATGSDTGRSYGTPSAPRKTIPALLGPGTYCEVQGSYNTNSGGWTIIKGAGTEEPWIAKTSGPAWIVGSGPDARASFSAKVLFIGRYLCAEHLDNIAGKRIFQVSSVNSTLGYFADHMLIRSCEVDGGNGPPMTAFLVNSNTTGATGDIIIHRNKFHGFGPDTPETTDVDAMGLMIGNGVRNVYALENEIFDMSGSGIAIGTMSTGPSTTSRVFVARNHVHDVWAAGIAAKTSNHVVFSENTVHDIKWTSWSQAKCIGAQYSIESLWIIGNHCYNGDLGIKIGSTSGPNSTNVYVIGNVVHDIYAKPENPSPPGETGYSGAITIWGGNHRFIIGNTISKCHNGIALPSVSTTEPLSAVIENNIIGQCIYNQIDIDLGASFPVIRNNLLHQPGGAAKLGLGSAHYTVATANALANISDLIEADPLFKDADNANYSIADRSPAKDAALAPAALSFDVFSHYKQEFGVQIDIDRNGLTRPQGSNWDIGAYESPPRLPPPSGLDVTPLPKSP